MYRHAAEFKITETGSTQRIHSEQSGFYIYIYICISISFGCMAMYVVQYFVLEKTLAFSMRYVPEGNLSAHFPTCSKIF